ncbi:MAG TPA: cytochrome c oxidase subunit II [Terracidiphilus sp.]|nr:cytochrome c oxidase subunit II [Terracidiphilus sp.]
MKSRAFICRWLFGLASLLLAGVPSAASPSTSTFDPASTPAGQLNDLSIFVLGISGLIFVGVSTLLVYALVRYRARKGETSEPAQVFGSVQIELSWTIIPILIIVVLFLTTARVLFDVQDARKPATALDVTVVGHQFWWEFRYPQYNVVTANELHVPMSSRDAPRPTFMKLTSADVMHSFWVPRLAGKTDLLPNRVNEMWIDPLQPGLYVGQCAQFCGAQHAKMLLRVYVDTPEQFMRWITNQQRSQPTLPGRGPGATPGAGNAGGVVHAGTTLVRANSLATPDDVSAEAENLQDISARAGQYVFEHQACISCHAVAGTVATGRFGPDLTHLMSRETIAAGAAPNTREKLVDWIGDPNRIKPGSLMPAMHLTDRQNEQVTAYLLTLK